MSSLFHVPDKRIVLANNTLYKVCVTRGGPLHHPDDTVSAEIEELLRAIIPLVSQCSNLKLQTEHLLAHYHLTTWSLPRKIQFEKQNILIDAHHRVINIAVLSKKQNGSQGNEDHGAIQSKKRRYTSLECSKSQRTSEEHQAVMSKNRHNAARESSVVNLAKEQDVDKLKTRCSTSPESSKHTKLRKLSNTRMAQSPQWPRMPLPVNDVDSGQADRTKSRPPPKLNKQASVYSVRPSQSQHERSTTAEQHRTKRSIHTKKHEDSPVPKRLPLHALSNERDKTLIAMEDMEEEIKLQQLTQLASPSPIAGQMEEQPRRSSLIGAALSLLLTPVKRLFRIETKD